MSIDTDEQKIETLLTRGVGEFIDPNGEFRKRLKTNPEKVVIKFGVDPTRPDIHLGHAVILHKLRQFQDMGCKVVFLVGDITAQIGDPTGKNKIRPEISQIEVENNVKTYLEQIGKILHVDFSSKETLAKGTFSWIRNSDWYVSITDIQAKEGTSVELKTNGNVIYKSPPLPGSHLFAKAYAWEQNRMQKNNIKSYSFINVLAALRRISYSRLIERDMFQKRINAGEPVFMHEVLYPVIQGMDSNILADIYGSCDLEVGGTDQHFNMLMGREVMEMAQKNPQAVLSFKILEGTDGKEKMSKSLDNYIGITDKPSDMYGKVMSIPDSSIANYFELCTFTPMDEVEKIRTDLVAGNGNPKEIKMSLAKQIVEIYHGKEQAIKAETHFVNTFQKKEIPEEMLEIVLKEGQTMLEALVAEKLVESKSEFRRLVNENAVTDLDTDEKITDANFIPKVGARIKIGKRRFVKRVK